MNEDGGAELGRGLEDREQLGIVQVLAIDVRADLDARQAQLAHAPLEFAHGERRRLHRQSPKPEKSLWIRRYDSGQMVVEHPRRLKSMLGLRPIVEHDRHRRKDLAIYFGAAHLLDAPLGFPTIAL